MREGEQGDWDLVSVIWGLVAGVVALGVVWVLVASLTGGHARAQSPDVAEPRATPADSPSATARAATSTPLSRCVTAARDLQLPLQAAEPAMDQWEVHIGAMNKLVTGAITLQQANAFWSQTRVGAHHRIGTFKDADNKLERQGVDCPAPRLLGSAASPALRGCAQHVAAELGALDSARTSISTWNHHMHAMDQLRDGKLSPTAATQMWLAMWQRGVRDLDAYRASDHAAQRTGTCEGGVAVQQPSPSVPPTSPGSPSQSPMSGMDMG